MTRLFQPLEIRTLRLPNRIAMSPMCQYSSTDGFANDWHLVHLGSRAIGGSGLVMTEATAVHPDGRITPFDLGIYNDAHISGLKKIADFIKAHGSIAGIQLAHAGRKASCRTPWQGRQQLTIAEGGWQTVAPSDLPYRDADRTPIALTEKDIEVVINSFADATRRALKAGFQLIEIHGAHGYLLHQFYSPLSNFRIDSYGGSFENRCRLLLEVTRAVRNAWPDELPIFVRISATDWLGNGWIPDDSVKLAKMLAAEGVDLIDCSSGGNAHAQISVKPGYQVPFAEKIKKDASIRTGAVGLITKAIQAEQILARGQADLILLGRQLLRDPYFPLHAAKELGADILWPVQYERGKES